MNQKKPTSLSGITKQICTEAQKKKPDVNSLCQGRVVQMNLPHPYPAFYMLEVWRSIDARKRRCYSVYIIGVKDDAFLECTSKGISRNSLSDAVKDVFQKFNYQYWTTETLLEAWKAFPEYSDKALDSNAPIGCDFLHFTAEDTWGTFQNWFNTRNCKRPLLEKTLALNSAQTAHYQKLMSGEKIDYAAYGIEENSIVKAFTVNFNDLGSVEMHLRAGQKDTPLYLDAVLYFRGESYHGKLSGDIHHFFGKFEVDFGPARFVRLAIDIQPVPSRPSCWFQGKTKNNVWIEGYYQTFSQEPNSDPGHYILTVKDDGQCGCKTEVLPESVGQYIGLPDICNNPIYSNSILLDPKTGKLFTPVWVENNCQWTLADAEGGITLRETIKYITSSPAGGNCLNLKVCGNALDGVTK